MAEEIEKAEESEDESSEDGGDSTVAKTPEFAYESEEDEEDEDEEEVTVLANEGDPTGDSFGIGDEGGGAQASLPSNVYSPSMYTLDPDTVNIETPESQLLYKTLEKNLADLDLTQYRNVASPPEYAPAVEGYNRVLLGE